MNKKFTVSQLAEAVNGTVEGLGDIEISAVAPIQSASDGAISFVANDAYQKFIATTKASALVLSNDITAKHKSIIRHENPYLAFAEIVDLLYEEEKFDAQKIDQNAVVDKSVNLPAVYNIGAYCHINANTKLGNSITLISNVYIGKDVTIGDNCLFYPGVKVMDGCKIGNNVILHSGAVIGSDGFGYAESKTGLKKIKQVGWVEIGDNVEIGSNTTIDRGAIGPTKIGRGTKIDNLVQIAHNVEVGEHTIIVSQVGISGSTKIGNGCILAGQVGLVGHIELGDGVKVGAQSGVSKSVEAGKTVFGYPARDIVTTKRIEASLKKLPDLLKRVKELEKKSE